MSKLELPSWFWDKIQEKPNYCLSDVRYRDGMTLIWAFVWNVGIFGLDAKRKVTSGGPTRAKVSMRDKEAEHFRSSDEISVIEMERREVSQCG